MSDEAVFELDRGQPVIAIVTFPHMPDAVYFSYTKPGSNRPYVDDGFGEMKSQIVQLSPNVYRYTFSTKGFEAGIGEWSFMGEWDEQLPDGYDEVVVRGKYRVRESAQQLF